jgi:hypothetical protein
MNAIKFESQVSFSISLVIEYPPEFAVDAGVGFAAGAIAGHIVNLN